MIENKKYYDIEVDALFEKGCTTIDDCFYLKDLKQRKLFIDDEICQETIFDITRHILQFNKEDRDIPVEERQPILLYISSSTTVGNKSDIILGDVFVLIVALGILIELSMIACLYDVD